jgi:hypothetical protein
LAMISSFPFWKAAFWCDHKRRVTFSAGAGALVPPPDGAGALVTPPVPPPQAETSNITTSMHPKSVRFIFCSFLILSIL